MTFLETARLRFRTHAPADEPAFIAMHTDAEVRRYVGGSPWSRDKAALRFRTQYLGKPERCYGLWAAILKDGDVYAGCCGLTKPERASAHLAYYLARPHWRRGLATEAAAAFARKAFEELKLERLAADVERGNHGSVRVLEKLGFVLAGRRRSRGGFSISTS